MRQLIHSDTEVRVNSFQIKAFEEINLFTQNKKHLLSFQK